MSSATIIDLKFRGFVNFLSDIGVYDQSQKNSSLEAVSPTDEDGILLHVVSEVRQLCEEELLQMISRLYTTYLSLAKLTCDRSNIASRKPEAKPVRPNPRTMQTSPEKPISEDFKKLRREQLSKINDQQNNNLITVHDKLYTDSFQKQGAGMVFTEKHMQELASPSKSFSPISNSKSMTPATPTEKLSQSKGVSNWAADIIHRPESRTNSVFERLYKRSKLSIKPELDSLIHKTSYEQSLTNLNNKSGLDNSLESNRGRHPIEKTFERLYSDAEKKKQNSKSQTRFSRESRELLACTFSPQINKISKSLASKNSLKKLQPSPGVKYDLKQEDEFYERSQATKLETEEEEPRECILEPEALKAHPHPREEKNLAPAARRNVLSAEHSNDQQTPKYIKDSTYNRLCKEMSQKDNNTSNKGIIERGLPPKQEAKTPSGRVPRNNLDSKRSCGLMLSDNASSVSSNQSSFRTADSTKNGSLSQKENWVPKSSNKK